jgi:hypothetical protein
MWTATLDIMPHLLNRPFPPPELPLDLVRLYMRTIRISEAIDHIKANKKPAEVVAAGWSQSIG